MAGRRVIVLGGGVAGICAAFHALERGFAVELIEGHRWLGGRAFTLPHRDMSEPCDNGPHVMLGCYVEMRALLRRLGTEGGFTQPRGLRLTYADANGGLSRLRLPPGPAPLAFGPALLALRGLGVRGRVRALLGLAAVLRDCPAEWTVADWMRAHRQEGAPRRYLWDPMCRAIMNAEPNVVAARVLLATLRRAFLGSGAAAAIWLPKHPWSVLIGEPARASLASRGTQLTLGRRVERLIVESGRVTGIAFADERVEPLGPGDDIVSALPWHALARVLPSGALPGAELRAAPLVSVYFDPDDDPCLPPDDLIALVDGAPFHFLARRPGARGFALLSGGGAGLEGLPAAATIGAALGQIARHFPTARVAASTRARVVKEARATFIASPGADPLRPKPGRLPGFDNLLVCGDWTATGLPSTLEGAAASARAATVELDPG